MWVSETFLALGKIRRWRWELLFAALTVVDNPSHLQAPAGVNFQMAMHKPNS